MQKDVIVVKLPETTPAPARLQVQRSGCLCWRLPHESGAHGGEGAWPRGQSAVTRGRKRLLRHLRKGTCGSRASPLPQTPSAPSAETFQPNVTFRSSDTNRNVFIPKEAGGKASKTL